MAVQKYYDVVYTTKSGKTMVARKILASSDTAAKAKFRKMVGISKNLKRIVSAVGLSVPLPKGMTKAIASNIKVTGLRKVNGRLQKGFRYLKGGKIVKAKPR